MVQKLSKDIFSWYFTHKFAVNEAAQCSLLSYSMTKNCSRLPEDFIEDRMYASSGFFIRISQDNLWDFHKPYC